MKHQILFIITCFLLSFSQLNFAQNPSGTLQGVVVDFNSSNPMAEVLIRIDGTQLSVHTDEAGFFELAGVPVGKYNLLCLKSRYYCTMSDPVEIFAGKVTEVKLRMLPGESDKFLYVSIGGITVTGDRDLIPESHETVHKISSGEIEHMQATNLGDVLDLIPGVERKNRPGLAKQSFVGLRGIEADRPYDTPDVFGTKIIVDEIPISNNMNMNEGVGVGYGSSVTLNAGNGVDLRGFVADNVREVEVVSGVPSVEYGDLTTGVVKVQTQTGARPLRFKIKTNPDTREFNLNGGNHVLSNLSINYNLNYAHSERDLRQDGDEVFRVSGQLNTDFEAKSAGFLWKNRLYYGQLFEDYYLPEDPRATRAEGKDYSINAGTILEKKLNLNNRIHFTGYLNYTRRKNYKRQFQVTDPTYVSDRMEPGTTEGILLTEPYFWEFNTLGKEFTLGLKLKMGNRFFISKSLHNLLYGIEYTYENNIGPGKQFDPLQPPYGNPGSRPRSFDDTPGFEQLSLFFEDRITGKFYFPMTFTAGIRSEMFNPVSLGGKDLINSKNGTFWNPRIGIQIKFAKGFQIRSSYGLTSKSPAIKDIYPDPVYEDVLEWGRNPNDPMGLDSIPLVTTYVYRLYNENLQAFTQKKFELGLDYSISNLGISITGYHQRTDGTISAVDLPYTTQRYSWPNWPSAEGKILKYEQPIILRNFQHLENLGWNIREGVELSLRTHRLPKLNMMFRISGAYNWKRHGYENSLDVDTPREFTEITSAGDTIAHYGYPMFPLTSGWRKSLIMNYNLDYVNRTLGIWITFTMYHKIYEKRQVIDLPDVNNYATGYYENGEYVFITQQKAAEMNLIRKEDEEDLIVYRYPASFYFNLTVSKHIWQGMEVSLFVNNFFNNRGFYTDQYGFEKISNPEIFYGLEFSMIMDPFAQLVKNRFF